jgi:hypothetical protein
MNAAASTELDALPKEAQRFFIARSVAFSCAFLERGESRFSDSAVLAAFRRDFGADLQSFSEQFWERLPSGDTARMLTERLDSALEVQDLPSGVDKFDGFAEQSIFIVMTACGWLTGEKSASRIAQMTLGLLRYVGGQEALTTSGRKTIRAKDVDFSGWLGPEQTWQAQYVDRARGGSVEELKTLAQSASQTLVGLIPRINSVIVGSRA